MEAKVKSSNISIPRTRGYEFSLDDLPVQRQGIILGPNGNPWESKAVFNAAAISKDDIVYLFYRAFGKDNDPKYKEIPERPSSIGRATSSDGIIIEERLNEPVLKDAEDPRITQLNGRYFMTYTKTSKFKPLNNWDPHPGIAVSDNLKDFKELCIMEIEGLEEVTKNVVLFPRKINEKYAAFARQKPDIFVVYSDDLIHWSNPQFTMGPREGCWDREFIGPGAVPIETPYGWLNIYHGVDKNDIYSLGASLHDLNDPSIVLARSIHPLLEPQEDYETKGIHPDVVYTCGAINTNKELRIYYGAADRVLALAIVNMYLLLERMKR